MVSIYESFVNQYEEVVTFLETLALCHTVQVAFPAGEGRQNEAEAEKWPEGQNVKPEYHASSTDEKALVEACAR
ncbi:hypothetical protein E2C01_086868 [Portunus trituberculatus]|uniref:Uncharacterized protein n=1 Tax=Portunus trituberculatus TaxID=210409 RepID=A0A5B7JFT0_PORTR|nr:hypothetical protein [Portunus trituberculatus]